MVLASARCGHRCAGENEAYLYEENMGATAIGTGITASPGYAEKCATHLAQITGKPIVLSKDLVAATSSMARFCHVFFGPEKPGRYAFQDQQ